MQTTPKPTEFSPTTLQARGILSDELDYVWRDVRDLIQASNMDEEVSLFDIYKGIKNRDLQLWVVWSEKIICACVTRIDIGNKKVLNILNTGGQDMGCWLHYFSVLENFAKFHGCDEIHVPTGRNGWRKILAQYGFESPHQFYRKKLNG